MGRVSKAVEAICNAMGFGKRAISQPLLWLMLFISGALITLAFSPFDIFILLPLSFTLFLVYLDLCKTHSQRFFAGFAFGYGHFFTSLYWIAYALLVDLSQFGWMIPLVLIFIPSVLSCFIGIFAVVVRYFRYNRVVYVLAFSSLWVLFELLRSFMLFPFPWNLLGYTSLCSDRFAQFASVVGVYGMSFVVCAISTCLYSRSKYYICIVLCCFAIIFGFGYWRLRGADIEYLDGPTLRLVQPNLKEHHMGDHKKQESDLLKLIKLSVKSLKDGTITIWPEATLPYVISDTSPLKTVLAELIAKDGILITGADWAEPVGSKWDIYNAVIGMDKRGEIIALYKKVVLLPFGEYIPARSLMPGFMEKVAYGIGDFSAGKEYITLSFGDNIQPILPMICFEAIFTSIPYQYRDKQFGIMLNLTNDSWFGPSIGPYQHYTMARMRAIEYATPVIRVAKYGISGVFDQYGRILAEMPLDYEGILDTKIPKKTLQSSIYVLYYHGSVVFLILLLYCLLLHKLRRA